MAIDQIFEEFRVTELPTSNLKRGDRHYLDLGNGKYKVYLVSNSLELISDNSSEFIEKDTMQEMRNLSSREIWALQNSIYKGVKLNGYYTQGDTPEPINYILTHKDLKDDGGSAIVVNGVVLVAVFKDRVNLKYFGLFNGSEDDTDIINNAMSAISDMGKEGIIVPYTISPIMIDGERSINGDLRSRGVVQKSNMVVEFESGARWKAKPAKSNSYCMWSLYNITNLKIINPWLIGDRDEHVSPLGNLYKQRLANTRYEIGEKVIIQSTGFIVTKDGLSSLSTPNNLPSGLNVGNSYSDGEVELRVLEVGLGQWGHCIEIYESKNIDFNDVRCEKSWGDGIYLGCSVDNRDRNTHNSNINLYGKSIFKNCRRQGVSVISCDNFYAQHLYGEDIVGQNPQAVIDFEPNFDYHTIWNAVVDNVTAIRCKYSALFASQSNRWGITINNIIDIDNFHIGALHFDGMGFTSTNKENYINIKSYYTNKCTKAPVRLTNWYSEFQGNIDIGKIIIGDWKPDADGEFSIVKMSYQIPDIPSAIQNLNIGDFVFNSLETLPNAIFRPFFMFSSLTNLHENNILKNINIKFENFDWAEDRKEDGVSLMPVYGKSVRSICIKNSSSFYDKTSSSILLKNGDIKYAKNSTNIINIVRRGFQDAILVNGFQAGDSASFTINLNPSSGFTTIYGDGITITNNSFTLRHGALLKLERVSDSELRVTSLYYGEQPITKVSAVTGAPNTNLLDIINNANSSNKLSLVQYDSSREGLINYPPIGRGHIYITTDVSTNSRCFIAISVYSGNTPYLAIAKVNSTETTLVWNRIGVQSSAVEQVSVDDATDLSSVIVLANSLKFILNKKLTSDVNSGQQSIT